MAKKKKTSAKKTELAPRQQRALEVEQVQANKELARFWPWLLAALAFLLYANTLGHQYAFDDAIVITQNSFTKQGFAGMYDLFTRDFFEGIYGEQGMELTGGRYRPLSLLMFALEYQFFGENPFVGHLLNVLLYALTVGLMYKLMQEFFGRASLLPLLASLLFAVHPLHTEVVANIKSRDEILALLLLIASYLFWQRARASVLAWALCLLSFFGALLAKETAFTFILLMPLAAYLLEPSKPSGKEVLRRSWPLWLVALGYLLLRHAMVGGLGAETNPDIMENPFVGASFTEKYATIGLILWRYLLLCIWPIPLVSDYSYNQIAWVSWSHPEAILGWSLYLGAGFYALWAWWQRKAIAWPLLCYLAPLSLTSNVLFNIGAPMGERFLYLSTWGFSFAVVWGLQQLYLKGQDSLGAWKSKWYLLLGFVLWAAFFAFLTVQRNPYWYNNSSLFAEDVQHSPKSAKIHYYHGNSILQEQLAFAQGQRNAQRLQESKAAFARSVEINPQFHTAWYNLGLVSFELAQAEEARDYLLQTLELQPKHIYSTELLAKVYGRYLQNVDSSLYYLRRAVDEMQRKTPENLKNLGIVYAMKGQYSEAFSHFEQALALSPEDAGLYLNYAIALSAAGQEAKAQDYFAKAYSLDPSLRRGE